MKDNKNLKKICLIISSLRHGGSERVMSELANFWCEKKNVEINLILLTRQEKFYNIDPRINLIEPHRSYKKNIISKILYKLWIIKFIRKKCIEIEPHSILSFNERYNNIVLLSLLGTKLRIFVSDRNNPYMDIGRIHNFLRNKLYFFATSIIAQTETAKKVLKINTKNNNIIVIPNPLRKIKEIKNNKTKKIILNVGRNVPQKNQLELLEIFSKCDYKDWKLKVFGNGPLHKELIQKVRDLNLEENVQILEFSKDIDLHYSQASIFAFSSLYEGFPNALVEAMAHGIPCVSYDCPTGPRDIINNGKNGDLIELKNKAQFIDKLSNLMKSTELRIIYSKEAIKVKEKYSLKLVTNKYFNFIS